MLFNVSNHLEYAIDFPSTLILSVHAQRNASQSVLDEHFSIQPAVKFEEFVSPETNNRFIRLKTGRSRRLQISYRASVDCQVELVPVSTLTATPLADVEHAAVPYIFPSRYCQSDKLSRLAWDLFGKIAHPYDKVLAIVAWIHDNVEYVRGSTTSDTSAYDTVTQRTGVCRDFAHLGITLCRALNIPARYFAGYAYQLTPPDFHACFECHIGGKWFVFDATHLAHLNGLVRIGTGRDAAEAAVASVFGSATCITSQVNCTLSRKEKFIPISKLRMKRTGVSIAVTGT